MTKLRDWFYLNRKRTSIRKMATELGINYPHALRVVNGYSRPSVKLAKRFQEFTHNEIAWHKVIEDACEKMEAKAKKNQE